MFTRMHCIHKVTRLARDGRGKSKWNTIKLNFEWHVTKPYNDNNSFCLEMEPPRCHMHQKEMASSDGSGIGCRCEWWKQIAANFMQASDCHPKFFLNYLLNDMALIFLWIYYYEYYCLAFRKGGCSENELLSRSNGSKCCGRWCFAGRI